MVIIARYTHFQDSISMRFRVSTVDHSRGKLQEDAMFGTLVWVRTKDGAEKSAPGPALLC